MLVGPAALVGTAADRWQPSYRPHVHGLSGVQSYVDFATVLR